jgi:hypothetical protein
MAAGLLGMTGPLTETADAKKKKKAAPTNRCVNNAEPCSVNSDCCDGNFGTNRAGASVCCTDFDEYCSSDAECYGEMR